MITLIFWEEVVDDNAQSASVQYCIVDGRLLHPLDSVWLLQEAHQIGLL